MLARSSLLLTLTTLLVPQTALANQSPHLVEADVLLPHLQEVKQNRVITEQSQFSKFNQASLLGDPQQIQIPSATLNAKPVVLESSHNFPSELVSNSDSSSAQLEPDKPSSTNPQSSAENDFSICTNAERFQPPFIPFGEDDKLPILEVKVSEVTVQEIETLKDKIIKDCRNRLLTPEQRTSLADAITRLYLNRDYITSRAVLEEPKGDKQNGYLLPIKVIEGSLERIEVVTIDEEKKPINGGGLLAVRPSYLCKRVQTGLGIPPEPLCNNLKPIKGNPLNTRKLEDQVRLLSLDPFIRNINPVLKSGTGDGKSVLRIEVENPKFLNFSFNNYSPPSIGAQRAELGLLFGSLASDGDIISASYSVDPFNFSTTRGFNSFNLGYRLPLSPKDNTLQLRLEVRREKIVQPPLTSLIF